MFKPIDKALLLRKSKHLRSKEPLLAWERRLRRPGEILRLVEKHAPDEGLKLEARRQYIVSIMTAFEIYWREFLRKTIDRNNLTAKQLKRVRGIKLSIAELDRIIGREITIGELLVSAYSFQGRSGVERLVGDLMDIDLYGELRRAQLTMVLADNGKAGKSEATMNIDMFLKNTIPVIDKCQEIRNHTVHDTGTLYRPSSKTIRRYDSNVGFYNLIVGLGVEAIFDKHGKATRTV